MVNRKIYKRSDGTFVDDGCVLSRIMYWDEYGAYLGQEQLNCLDDDPDSPPTIFLHAQGNDAGRLGLTQDEMDRAEPQ